MLEFGNEKVLLLSAVYHPLTICLWVKGLGQKLCGVLRGRTCEGFMAVCLVETVCTCDIKEI